jgi:hypothetical protein
MNDSADTTAQRYIDPTDEQGRALFTKGIQGPVLMLNLLRFREIADYGAHPDLAPETEVSGRRAYDTYSRHTLPYLEALGGSVTFSGDAQPFLIGPSEETWDVAMVVRHANLDAFLSMATDPGYMAGIGHREAALEDSRLLPIVEHPRRDLVS